MGELDAVQGESVDLGGYYFVDREKADAVMRPSETFNTAINGARRRTDRRMGERTSYPPGTFSWAELATSDAGAAKAFYTSVFGWDYRGQPAARRQRLLDGDARRRRRRGAVRDQRAAAALELLRDRRVGRRERGARRASSARPSRPSRSTSWTSAGWR